MSRPLLAVLDWDGTIAVDDTLALIAPSPAALKPFSEAYGADYKELSDKLGERNSLPKMQEFLDAMEDLEYKSVKRVEDGDLFKGMPRESLLHRARDHQKLDLQKGAVEFLKHLQGSWGIVSVGWSGDFIRAALESRGVDLQTHQVEIRANEVEFDQDGRGTGLLSKHKGNASGIRTARDKLREMRKMARALRGSDATGDDSRLMYIGDSETDLMCLLEADIGVIMGSESMADKCRHLGIEVETDLPELSASATRDPKRLYFARTFQPLVAKYASI